MKKEQTTILINHLTPKLFSFAFALTADEAEARSLVVDGYTIFLIQEGSHLLELELDSEDQRSRLATKKFIMTKMIQSIFELSLKRNDKNKSVPTDDIEFEQFYALSSTSRALLFLREILEFSVESIQSNFTMQRHQVIESLANSRASLMSGAEVLSSIGINDSTIDHTQKALISALVNGTLKIKDQAKITDLIHRDENYHNYFKSKKSENDFLKQLIPDKQVSRNSHSLMRDQLKEINEDIYPVEKIGLVRKAINYLNSPLIEI